MICLLFAEAEAAQKAGLKTVIVVREGNELLTEEDKVSFPVIKSFHDFVFEASAKRKKMCTKDESPANGPISETSKSSNTEKNKAVKKTEVASPESAGSGNAVSSSDCEMMDVSSNDAQVTGMEPDKTKIESQSTDDKKMAVEDSDTKESEKVELEPDDSEVSKTESSAPESKTVGAPDVEKESLKVCSENAEECNGKEVPETSLTKLSAEVEVSKVNIDVKLNDSKADEKDSEAGETEVDIKGIPVNGEETKVGAEETEAVGVSSKDKNVEVRVSENDSRDGAELETVSGDSKNKSVGRISNSLESESGALETGSEEGKIDSCDGIAEVNAGDKKEKFCDSRGASSDVKGDSSNEDANLEEIEADTQNKKTDINNTETEEKMETNTTEIENVKGINEDDVKDTEKNDRDTLAAEMEDEITEEMESSAKLGEKDVALKKKMDMESGGTANGREKGENAEPSEDLSVSEESGVTKLESEVATKTESDIIPHQTEHNECASGGNKSPENTDASPEESKTEESSKEPESADKMLQDKMEDVSGTVKNEDSELLATSDNDTAKEDANANEDTKPLDCKNEGDDESKTAEDTAKENGLAFTTENGKGDVTNKCPDTEQNGEMTDKGQDVKIKKLSIDGSGNSSMTKDDVAIPVVASGSS